MALTVSSAILSAAEVPQDKHRPTESGAGRIPSLNHFVIFGAVIAGAWYGWKVYHDGRRYFRPGGNSDPFGRGRGMMWADSILGVW